MIPELLVGTALAFALGVPLTALGVAWERMEKGMRCAPAPAWRAWLKPLAAATADFWARLRSEWAEIARVERELRGMFRAPEPVPAPRRPVNGRYLGTQPRREGPFTQVDMPALAEDGPEPAPGETCQVDPDVPIARPFAPQPTWGEACEIDVAEAERLKEAMIP